MKRSEFLVGAAMLPFLPTGFSHAAQPAEKLPLIKPKKLRKGDCIGLAAPAGFIKESDLLESVANLEKLGFTVKTDTSALNRNGYFAGTDTDRAEALMRMFTDDKVDAIMCVRGGYGASRILPLLDYQLIRKNPKILIGYSDITALHAALYAKAGLISFHGPVGTSTFNEFSVDNFSRVLMQGTAPIPFTKAPEPADKADHQLSVIRSGKSSGVLMGGNLSIVVSLIGTEYDVSYDGAMVYLEEIGEEPYRVDRMLTQMIQAGKFAKATGVALGIFRNCNPKEKESGIGNSFTLSEVLMNRLYDLQIPVLYGLSFGHVENKLTLPFGTMAELDSNNGALTLTESAVV